MNKEEILEKSRQENKNQDVYEKEVLRMGGNAGAVTAIALATIFFAIQVFVGEGMNYGLYAIVFSVLGTGFVVKAIKLKRKHEIAVAIAYILLTLLLSAAHIYNLITTSTIL
jgi:hypothetical protein